MSKKTEFKKYLIDHAIDFYESESGVLSIDINAIPKKKFYAYHQFCYQLQKKYKKIKEQEVEIKQYLINVDNKL